MLRTMLLAFAVLACSTPVLAEVREPEPTTIRNYDIRSFFTNDPPIETPAFLRDSRHEEAVMFESQTREDESRDQEFTEQIVSVIQDTVGRQNEWRDYGGDRADIKVINRQLIVRQTEKNHAKIERLLDSLRPGLLANVTLRARIIDLPKDVAESALLAAHQITVETSSPAKLEALVEQLQEAGGTLGPSASLSLIERHRGQAMATADEGQTGITFVARPSLQRETVVIDLRAAANYGPAGEGALSTWNTTVRVPNYGAVVLSSSEGDGGTVRALVLHASAVRP
ncbi:MAG: hypothetical protein AAF823_00645 [Planctomycetota bacterium]